MFAYVFSPSLSSPRQVRRSTLRTGESERNRRLKFSCLRVSIRGRSSLPPRRVSIMCDSSRVGEVDATSELYLGQGIPEVPAVGPIWRFLAETAIQLTIAGFAVAASVVAKTRFFAFASAFLCVPQVLLSVRRFLRESEIRTRAIIIPKPTPGEPEKSVAPEAAGAPELSEVPDEPEVFEESEECQEEAEDPGDAEEAEVSTAIEKKKEEATQALLTSTVVRSAVAKEVDSLRYSIEQMEISTLQREQARNRSIAEALAELDDGIRAVRRTVETRNQIESSAPFAFVAELEKSQSRLKAAEREKVELQVKLQVAEANFEEAIRKGERAQSEADDAVQGELLLRTELAAISSRLARLDELEERLDKAERRNDELREELVSGSREQETLRQSRADAERRVVRVENISRMLREKLQVLTGKGGDSGRGASRPDRDLDADAEAEERFWQSRLRKRASLPSPGSLLYEELLGGSKEGDSSKEWPEAPLEGGTKEKRRRAQLDHLPADGGFGSGSPSDLSEEQSSHPGGNRGQLPSSTGDTIFSFSRDEFDESEPSGSKTLPAAPQGRIGKAEASSEHVAKDSKVETGREVEPATQVNLESDTKHGSSVQGSTEKESQENGALPGENEIRSGQAPRDSLEPDPECAPRVQDETRRNGASRVENASEGGIEIENRLESDAGHEPHFQVEDKIDIRENGDSVVDATSGGTHSTEAVELGSKLDGITEEVEVRDVTGGDRLEGEMEGPDGNQETLGDTTNIGEARPGSALSDALQGVETSKRSSKNNETLPSVSHIGEKQKPFDKDITGINDKVDKQEAAGEQKDAKDNILSEQVNQNGMDARRGLQEPVEERVVVQTEVSEDNLKDPTVSVSNSNTKVDATPMVMMSKEGRETENIPSPTETRAAAFSTSREEAIASAHEQPKTSKEENYSSLTDVKEGPLDRSGTRPSSTDLDEDDEVPASSRIDERMPFKGRVPVPTVTELVDAANKLVKSARKRGLAVAQSDILFKRAVSKLEAAMSLGSERGFVQAEFGGALLAWAKVNLADPAAYTRLTRALGHLSASLDARPDDATTIFDTGLCLCLLASTSEAAQAKQYYTRACELYDRLLGIDADSRIGSFNCGLAYISLGRLTVADDKSDAETSIRYFEKAAERFGRALELRPGDNKAESYLEDCHREIAQLRGE